jgi:hypothetical protein
MQHVWQAHAGGAKPHRKPRLAPASATHSGPRPSSLTSAAPVSATWRTSASATKDCVAVSGAARPRGERGKHRARPLAAPRRRAPRPPGARACEIGRVDADHAALGRVGRPRACLGVGARDLAAGGEGRAALVAARARGPARARAGAPAGPPAAPQPARGPPAEHLAGRYRRGEALPQRVEAGAAVGEYPRRGEEQELARQLRVAARQQRRRDGLVGTVVVPAAGVGAQVVGRQRRAARRHRGAGRVPRARPAARALGAGRAAPQGALGARDPYTRSEARPAATQRASAGDGARRARGAGRETLSTARCWGRRGRVVVL